MAFTAVNGYDVEHASQLLIYENILQGIQHINGKGCIDKYTPTNDIESVTYIDVMRVLPLPPRFRQIGATNNGGFHNKVNEGGFRNAPQSTHYSIPVDLIYDEGVPITSVQVYSNPIALKEQVMTNIIQSADLSINIITYAKQIEGFFRNGDNFDKAKAHDKGAVVAADVLATEIKKSVFAYDPTAVGPTPTSPTTTFIRANNSLNNGVIELGAFVTSVNQRQAFISAELDTLMMAQYATNASEAAARINATGFINPFTNSESTRINEHTGLLGMYNGLYLFLFNDVTRSFVYDALGILGTSNDASADLVAVRTTLDKMQGMIVYANGTCRGIVGPTIQANPNTYYGGVYILPGLKVGVDVLHGASIKMIVDGGTNLATAWTAADIAKVINTIKFTAIDGDVVKADNIAGFNTGTTN